MHQQQVSNVVEILDMGEDSDDEENGATNAKAKSVARSHGKSCVVRTSTRQTIFLPVPGLVDVTTVRVVTAPGGCSAIVLFFAFRDVVAVTHASNVYAMGKGSRARAQREPPKTLQIPLGRSCFF
jgi:hypothetical protein